MYFFVYFCFFVDGTWRCPHIHFYIQCNGFEPLVTQMMFEGQEKNDVDNHILPELTVSPILKEKNGVRWWDAEFNIKILKKD